MWGDQCVMEEFPLTDSRCCNPRCLTCNPLADSQPVAEAISSPLDSQPMAEGISQTCRLVFIRDPWVDMILTGEKTMEVRTFRTTVGGRLFIMRFSVSECMLVIARRL